MSDSTRAMPTRGDRAPDFELPAADREGTIALAEHRRQGPVLLVMLRGLYCPFCRRQISQLRPTCETLRAAGIGLLGVVIAGPERARQYFKYFPPCFPIVAAPDRATHRAYGLPEAERTPEGRQRTEEKAAKVLAEMGIEAPPGQAAMAFGTADGFEATDADVAEWKRPLQALGYFLIGGDGVVRWSRVDTSAEPLPAVEELLALV